MDMFGQENHRPNRIALAENDGHLYDVIEVDIESRTVLLMTDEPKDARNADAVMRMALMRRGNADNYFDIVPAGTYADGDTLK